MTRLLLIDDDIEFCELLSECLGSEGFELTPVHDGKEGLEQALAGRDLYDLIILDLMLPGMSGFEILRRLRSEFDKPVVMFTGRDQEFDRLIALEMGADDFIVKPCSAREFIARINAILRRAGGRSAHASVSGQSPIAVGDVVLDSNSRAVRRNGEVLYLTSVEFNLLHALLEAAGRVVPRERLASQVLGRDLSAYDRSLDVHVSRLRKKLGHKFNGIERIKTVRKVGYLYALPQILEQRVRHD